MLHGERVMLTPLRDEDSATLFRWINDRELVELSAPFAPVDEAAHAEWFDDVRNRDDVAIFAIREGDRLVGTCQLREIDRAGGTAELRIRIGERDAWGRGLGTEAVQLLVRHAFEDLGLRRVRLEAFATNARALRAYEKAGFRRDGAYGDVVVMAVDAPS